MDKTQYKPQKQAADVLTRAMGYLKSVPYKVTLRWLFYNLYQDGTYTDKSQYQAFSKTISRARHAFWGGWHPNTLSDDTRRAVIPRGGWGSVDSWVNSFGHNETCTLDHWLFQNTYIEIWFEARAMKAQFQHYTNNVVLVPMAGHPSISFKYQMAKRLEAAGRDYGLPIVVLYFGDLDTGGKMIPKVAKRDVEGWCDVDFDFIRCGINPEHPARYNMTENFEKPGEYQWEALADAAAKELITTNVNRFVRQDAIREASQAGRAAAAWVNEWLRDLPGAYRQAVARGEV